MRLLTQISALLLFLFLTPSLYAADTKREARGIVQVFFHQENAAGRLSDTYVGDVRITLTEKWIIVEGVDLIVGEKIIRYYPHANVKEIHEAPVK